MWGRRGRTLGYKFPLKTFHVQWRWEEQRDDAQPFHSARGRNPPIGTHSPMRDECKSKSHNADDMRSRLQYNLCNLQHVASARLGPITLQHFKTNFAEIAWEENANDLGEVKCSASAWGVELRNNYLRALSKAHRSRLWERDYKKIRRRRAHGFCPSWNNNGL